MKKIIMVFTLLIIAITSVNAQSYDFRTFNWGASMEKVRADEKAPFISKVKNYELEYDDKLGGTSFKVLYIFNENNNLISGVYILSKKYSNPELYYHDYATFLALLSEKYGEASKQKETWNSSDSGLDKSNKKQAIADKSLNLYAVWYIKRTTIKITLITIGNDVPSLQIHYTANSLDEFENPVNLKDALNKL